MFSRAYMQEAYNLACKAYSLGEVPVGAIITEKGKVLTSAYNQVEKLRNPLAHAEMIAINNALEIKNTKDLENCEIHITLEPCYMCAYAISLTKIKTVYFATRDLKEAKYNGSKLYNLPQCNHKPEIIEGIMEHECRELLKSFFVKLRGIRPE